MMRVSMMFACLIGLLAALPARATTGLEWQMGDAPLRYHLRAQVQLPEVLFLHAQFNDEVRVHEVRVHLVTSCRPADALGRRGWELACSIDDLALQVAPVTPDAGQAAPVLQDWDDKLTGATLQVVLHRDGRVKNVDLEGIEKDERRMQHIVETMRLLTTRAFALLDLELPRKGDDKGKGEWKQRQSLALGFVTTEGTIGSSRVVHRIVDETDGVVTIETEGEATQGPADTVAVASQERTANLYEMDYTGSARFDTAAGRLIERTYFVHATPTASSVNAEGSNVPPYVQRSALTLLEEGESPELPENAEIVREPVPATTGRTINEPTP